MSGVQGGATRGCFKGDDVRVGRKYVLQFLISHFILCFNSIDRGETFFNSK